MPHVILLGDSIFDNAAYTAGDPDVVSQVRKLLPSGWAATLLAVDGHRTEDVNRQLARLPKASTHLVLSVGGNDALSHGDLLTRPARSAAEVLTLLAGAAGEFEERYRRLIARLLQAGLPLTVCTIYNGNFPDRDFQRIASTALSSFNDAILRVGFERRLTIIDLRLVCDEPADYANPIEPSSIGGAKIARAIAAAVGATNMVMGSSRIVVA
jgi:lysophospholipase L1-like esterase